jgi:hypothetical protein
MADHDELTPSGAALLVVRQKPVGCILRTAQPSALGSFTGRPSAKATDDLPDRFIL